jgi:hypothetical protein
MGFGILRAKSMHVVKQQALYVSITYTTVVQRWVVRVEEVGCDLLRWKMEVKSKVELDDISRFTRRKL